MGEKKFIDPTNKTMRHLDKHTRQGVVDTDRYEQILKDEPKRLSLKFEKRKPPKHLRKAYPTKTPENVVQMETTIRLGDTPWHEEGMPNNEWHARLRENDDSAPYNAQTGCYLLRDKKFCTRLGKFSGQLGPQPWRHASQKYMDTMDATQFGKYEKTYASMVDFERHRMPPETTALEDFLHKDPSRKALTKEDMTGRFSGAWRPGRRIAEGCAE